MSNYEQNRALMGLGKDFHLPGKLTDRRNNPATKPDAIQVGFENNCKQNNGQHLLAEKATPEHVETFAGLLAQDAIIFPDTNQIVINNHGVFVPQSILGKDVKITALETPLPDGGVRVTISANPINKQERINLTPDMFSCDKELRWLAEHGKEYTGQWVALNGDQLISHGTIASEVYKAARESGVELPLVVEIEPSNNLPFGGW